MAAELTDDGTGWTCQECGWDRHGMAPAHATNSARLHDRTYHARETEAAEKQDLIELLALPGVIPTEHLEVVAVRLLEAGYVKAPF